MTDGHPMKISTERCRIYLEFLRCARAQAQEDSEDFDALLHAFERIGSMECREVKKGLGCYEKALLRIAEDSPLACEIPTRHQGQHINAKALFGLLKNERNSAVHQGAVARSLVRHAIEFSLILEHALSKDMTKASELMIRGVVCADLQHPISYIRQQMLENAFSYLPVQRDQNWHLVSDANLAKWLRSSGWEERKGRLAMPLMDALQHNLKTIEAKVEPSDKELQELLSMFDDGVPLVLLRHAVQATQIEGLLTPYDLL